MRGAFKGTDAVLRRIELDLAYVVGYHPADRLHGCVTNALSSFGFQD
jgi:hypothetical protein